MLFHGDSIDRSRARVLTHQLGKLTRHVLAHVVLHGLLATGKHQVHFITSTHPELLFGVKAHVDD